MWYLKEILKLAAIILVLFSIAIVLLSYQEEVEQMEWLLSHWYVWLFYALLFLACWLVVKTQNKEQGGQENDYKRTGVKTGLWTNDIS